MANQTLGWLLSRGAATEIKSSGSRTNPITAWFQGYSRPADIDFDPTDEGLVRAYFASLWAYRCINIRGKRLSSIPLVIKTLDDEYIDKHGRPVNERVSSMANQHVLQRLIGQRFKRTLRLLEYDLCIWGRGFLEPSQQGLFRLNPSTIEILTNPKVGLEGFRQTIGGSIFAEWEADGLLYFFDFDPADDFNGLSPLAFALRSVGAEVNVGDFVESYFANDATPAGILSTDQPLLDSDIERTTKWWKKLFGGTQNKHRVGVVGNGLKFEPISSTLQDMALADLRLEIRREVTAALGVPMTIALADEAANFSTSKEQHIAFYTETVLPELEMIVDIMNEHLVPKFSPNLKVVIELSGIDVLQEARNEVANRAFSGFAGGVNTLNESRQLVGAPPLDEDYLNVPNVGLVRVSDLPKLADRALAAPMDMGDMGTAPPADPSPPTPQPPPDQPPLKPSNPPKPAPDANESGNLPKRPQGGEQTVGIISSGSGYVPTMRSSGSPVWDDAIKTAALGDLTRWRKKALGKKATAPFKSAIIPSAVQTFLRWDLEAADGNEDAVKSAFNAAKAVLASTDPTPEEFQTFWDGIDDVADKLMDQLGNLIDDPTVQQRVAELLEQTADVESAVQLFDTLTEEWVNALVGSEDQPGTLTQVFMAGAARGQELHDKMREQNAPPAPIRAAVALPVSWQLLAKDALSHARRYSYDLVRGINQTTAHQFRAAMNDWLNRGGSLPGLTDLLMGRLKGLDVPAGWTPEKIKWATSRARARLIAQTESTRAFTEGNVRRWQQLGVKEVKWRTQNDTDVCQVCKDLGKPPFNIGQAKGGFTIPPIHSAKYKKGKIERPPLHPGCRCFVAPVTSSRINPLEAVSPDFRPSRKPRPGEVVVGTKPTGVDAGDMTDAELAAMMGE